MATAAMPRISIVTPSFNQGQFLEATIKSVLDQRYPDLEYLVIDGGSSDNSVDIIRQYAGSLAFWVSEPDQGQYHALNKGFERSTGAIMGWLNSDDVLLPWTLSTVARIFQELPRVSWLTSRTQVLLNTAGEPTAALSLPGVCRNWFYRGRHLGSQPGFVGYIQQEATFWRRELWEAAGGRVDASLALAGDFELWARFFLHADLATTDLPLASFRKHAAQKSSDIECYYREAERVLLPYRARAVQHPALVTALQAVFNLTGLGGARFGSRAAQVRYDSDTQHWKLKTRICL